MSRSQPAERGPLRVVMLNWRDTGHPEGGGSELYVENVAAGLVALGHEVTLLTARYADSAADEMRHGVRIMRAGGRFTVYVRAALRLVLRRMGDVDVVVDVQNGLPFLARLFTRRPVVVLCHHVHRDQWGIVFGQTWWGRHAARFGWWIESRLAPWVYRGCPYITVSEISKSDLAALGVRAADVTVVRNGTPRSSVRGPRGASPEVLVLGRLVPHKRVEHAVRAVATLRSSVPDVRLTIVGQGWWAPQIRAEISRLGMQECVAMEGFVDEERKHRLLSRAWVLATPSVAEGWGLCVVEAAAHGTPAVAYRSAGGLAESILDGRTGLLADDDESHFAEQVQRLLRDGPLRTRTAHAAAAYAEGFNWSATTYAFAGVLAAAVGRREPPAVPLPRRPDDVRSGSVRAG